MKMRQHPIRHVWCIGLLATCFQAVSAQTSDLQWHWMNEAVVDGPNFKSSATRNEQRLMETVWAKEIAAAPSNARGRSPSFILVSSVKLDEDTYVFSLYDRAAYAPCEPPPNGRAATRLYSVCPLRVIRFDAAGKGSSRDYPGFCRLNLDFPDTPRAKTHTEYAVDPHTATVYLRVVQYGKVVPQCGRALKFSQ
jgi:hypothetical protein